MSTPDVGPKRHRLSVSDYHRMAEVGLLAPDARVELIDGEIIDMAPSGCEHCGSVGWLTKLLVTGVGDRAMVWTQNAIRLSDFSEPQPDFAVLRPRPDAYLRTKASAADVLLMIEVSYSSLAYDRDRKLPLYARHGIPEVWVVDVESARLIRASRPEEGGYADVVTLDPDTDGELLAALPCGALDDVLIDVNGLLMALRSSA